MWCNVNNMNLFSKLLYKRKKWFSGAWNYFNNLRMKEMCEKYKLLLE